MGFKGYDIAAASLEIPKIHVADTDRIAAFGYKTLVRDVELFGLGGLYALARKKAK